MVDPVVLAFLCADRVIREDNGKLGLIGVFGTWGSWQFPVVFPPWFIYLSLTNLQGEFPFALNLTARDTQQVLFSVGGQLQCPDRNAHADIVIPIEKAAFPAPGLYQLSMLLEGRAAASRMIEVKKIDAPPGFPPAN